MQACVPDFFLLTLPYLVSARDALVQCPQVWAAAAALPA